MFVVIYRWRVKAEREEEFRKGWKIVTEGIRKRDGSLGARLHRTDNNTWLSYAQWPNRQAWEQAWQRGPVDEPLAYHLMKSSIVPSRNKEKPYLTMTLTDDCFESDTFS